MAGIRNPWASDEGYTPLSGTPVRSYRFAAYGGFAVAAAVIGIGAWVLTAQPGRLAGGDPGGRVLAQIAPVADATPDGVKVNYRNLSEPQVDSCDGRASTRGWSSVVVQVNFDWTGPPQQVIALVDQKMQALSWARGPSGESDFLPSQEWDKQLTNGTTAHTDLAVSPDPKSWTLITFAQPQGGQVSGC